MPPSGTPPASIYDHALTYGFSRGFEVAAGIGVLALLIAITTIRISRQELASAGPEPQAAPQPAHVQPATGQPASVPPSTVEPTALQAEAVQLPEDRAALAAAVRPCRFC